MRQSISIPPFQPQRPGEEPPPMKMPWDKEEGEEDDPEEEE